MRLPVIQGVIRRRILVNFRVDPDVLRRQLPSPFSPKLQRGHAIAGICLIRLETLRPRWVPAFAGLSSESAAHRAAVTWRSDSGEAKEGVYIPRRDTSSWMNSLAGGRLFPGEYHHASFEIAETPESIDFRMTSKDDAVSIRLAGRRGGGLPSGSCFASLDEASRFFENGALGYSPVSGSKRLDGMELKTRFWRVEPLQVAAVASSYFADEARFPSGSVEFDCALLMRDVPHEWRGAEGLSV